MEIDRVNALHHVEDTPDKSPTTSMNSIILHQAVSLQASWRTHEKASFFYQRETGGFQGGGMREGGEVYLCALGDTV